MKIRKFHWIFFRKFQQIFTKPENFIDFFEILPIFCKISMSVFGKEWRFMASEPVAEGGLCSHLLSPRLGGSTGLRGPLASPSRLRLAVFRVVEAPVHGIGETIVRYSCHLSCVTLDCNYRYIRPVARVLHQFTVCSLRKEMEGKREKMKNEKWKHYSMLA